MTKAKEHIEEMHARLKKIADHEQLLIQALNEALVTADRKLLDDVRSVSMEHEARRAVILTELQSLAARIGAFGAPEEPVAIIDEAALDLPYYEPEDEPAAADVKVSNGGDWRKAAEKIRDDFTIHLARHKIAS